MCTLTVLPAKWTSTSGSTRFFLLLSKPRICLIPSMKASSTGGREGGREGEELNGCRISKEDGAREDRLRKERIGEMESNNSERRRQKGAEEKRFEEDMRRTHSEEETGGGE